MEKKSEKLYFYLYINNHKKNIEYNLGMFTFHQVHTGIVLNNILF